MSCGFVSWVDDQEWLVTLQNALARLWEMYHDTNNARIDEGVEHGKLLAIAAEEKTKAEKKYASLMADVGMLLDDSHKKVMQQNYKMINGKAEVDVVEMEKERDSLKTAVEMLKQVQKTQADMMHDKEKEWEEERKHLKAEKRAVEHQLLDLLRANSSNRDKISRIKAIVEE